MDFHRLARKELQTLCKRNKIPANITNVAMADALKALEIVEGLEEFMDQSQSPEKTMNKSSQEIPSTVTRTSTRRKTTKEEPQSTQPTTRTRRTTRRTVELGEENKNVNVPDNPVMATITRRRAQKSEPEPEGTDQKKSDLPETPALQSSRRRPGVGSTRRKVEAQKEGSVQQSYGTRRSVRLLEKCMEELSMKQSEKTGSVKIDDMAEGEVENKNAEATSEVPLARNLSASLDDERDLKDDVLENNRCQNGENADSHTCDNLGGLSALDTKDATPKEKTDEPESEDQVADVPDEIIGPKGSDNVVLSEDSHEIVNLNEKPVADEIKDAAVSEKSYEISINLEEFVADVTMSIEAPVAAFEDTSEQALDHSSATESMEPIEVASGEGYANIALRDLECQMLVGGKDCDINAVHDDLAAKLPEAEEYDEWKASQNVSVLPKGHIGSSDIDGTESDCNSLAGELHDATSCEQKSISVPTADYSSDDLMTNMVDEEEALVDVNVAEAEIFHVRSFHNASQCTESDCNSLAGELHDATSCEQKCISVPTADYSSDDLMTNMVDEEEALVDVNVAEAEIFHVRSFHNASQSVVDDIPVHKMVDYGDAQGLVDVCVKPAEEFAETAKIPPEEKSPTAEKLKSPCASLISDNLITNSIPLSPLTAQFSEPTRFTPRKSSTKKQTIIPRVTQVSDNINKENIENNNMKELEPGQGKVKKNKTILDEETMQNLEDKSLRYLKKLNKMFDKLHITDNMKNREDKNVSKQPCGTGKSRPALQTLPQNCMRTAKDIEL